MFVMKFATILFLVYLSDLVDRASAVKINKLKVPSIINHGTSVILDCDFTLEESEQDLVVKWYFNKTLVYQWIPGTKKKPQGLGILKDKLNLEYEASVDANSIYRAMQIRQAGPDLSGDYTCSVSTIQSEDVATKSMLVLVSERYLMLRRLSADEGYMRVQCLAEGVFPKPVMSLHSQEREITEAEVSVRQKGRLYEISATATLPALKDPEEFTCKLHIPQANYTTRRETVFYPDLGTTNSCMSIYKDGHYDILPNKGNERLTSSFVFVQRAGVAVGVSGFKQSARLPKNGIYEIKRLIGYEHDDRDVQVDIQWLNYEIKRGENNEIFIQFQNYDELKTPIEISAFILHKLKRDAEEKLKTELKKVVVTVPAYFNSVQKAATKQAAIVAGFKTVQLLNEPTAAALGYIYQNRFSGIDDSTILVFDLGGGTFDVSIVQINHNTVAVKSVYGDSHLGGELFLRNLLNFVKLKIMKYYPEIRSFSERSKRRLRYECEEAKKQLTYYDNFEIVLESFEGIAEVGVYITREEYDEMNKKLYERALQVMDGCIEMSDIPKTEISKVLLVGGASLTPKIRSMLGEYFDNSDIIDTNLNSDEAVAIGAGIQAHSLFGLVGEENFFVQDVIPMSIGLVINNGEYVRYIDRNTPIPVEVSIDHDICHLQEKMFQVSFFEGNTGRNILLGAKIIKLIDEADTVTIKIAIKHDEVFEITITGDCVENSNFELKVRGSITDDEIETVRQRVQKELLI